jgi:hypothetical protein
MPGLSDFADAVSEGLLLRNNLHRGVFDLTLCSAKVRNPAAFLHIQGCKMGTYTSPLLCR